MAQQNRYFEYLRKYAAAVPSAYRARYDGSCVADHARIAYRRGRHAVAAGTCRGSASAATPICIVGTDSKAILAAMKRAASLSRFEWVDGEAHTLDHRLGLRSIVTLVSVRHPDGGRLEDDEASFLCELIEAVGNHRPRARRRALAQLKDARRSQSRTHVRFLAGLDGTLSALEIETSFRSGLLPTLVEVLASERVQIVHCQVQARPDGVRDRLRLVDHDGASLEASRWRQLQVQVLDAIARAAEPTRLTT